MENIENKAREMDRINQRILTFLQRDAAMTNSALAALVGLAPSSCLRRVQALKDRGIIRAVVALLDGDKINRSLTAIVDIRLASDNLQLRQNLIDMIKQEPAVSQAHAVTGDSDIILILNLADMKEYQRLCERLIVNDPNITKYRTSFSIECVKSQTALPVDGP